MTDQEHTNQRLDDLEDDKRSRVNHRKVRTAATVLTPAIVAVIGAISMWALKDALGTIKADYESFQRIKEVVLGGSLTTEADHARHEGRTDLHAYQIEELHKDIREIKEQVNRICEIVTQGQCP